MLYPTLHPQAVRIWRCDSHQRTTYTKYNRPTPSLLRVGMKLSPSLLRVGMKLSPSLLRVGMRLSDSDLLQTAEPFYTIYNQADKEKADEDEALPDALNLDGIIIMLCYGAPSTARQLCRRQLGEVASCDISQWEARSCH
jgi:hypothetical protein